MATTENALTQDEVFDILSSPRRRYLLYYLRQVEEPVRLTDLSEAVAAWENDTEAEDLTDQQRKRVYVSLYQTHVPKLVDAGVLHYDDDSGTVSLAEGASGIDVYLNGETSEVDWPRIYILLTGLSALLVGLVTLEVWVFGAISETVLAATIVTVFAVTAVVHFLVRMRENAEIPEELRRE